MIAGNCLIVCSGSLANVPGHVAEVVQDAYCVAVDGGLKHFSRLKRKPEFWVGDADSIKPAELKRLGKGVRQVKLPRSKAYTDLEYALHLVGDAFLDGEWEGNVILLGAQGGRFDHDVGNLLSVQRWLQDLAAAIGQGNCPGVAAYGEHGLWIATMSDVSFHQPKGRIFSITSFEPSPRIDITGAKYNLKAKRLDHASMGLSNEGVGKNVTIRVHPPATRHERIIPIFIFMPQG